MWTDGLGGLTDFGFPWSDNGRLAIITAHDGIVVAGDATQPIATGGKLAAAGPVRR